MQRARAGLRGDPSKTNLTTDGRSATPVQLVRASARLRGEPVEVAAAVDAGYLTGDVMKFSAARLSRRVLAIRGRGGPVAIRMGSSDTHVG